MRKFQFILSVIFICLLSTQHNAYSRTLEFNLNDKSAQVLYTSFVKGGDYGRTVFNTGFLYNSSQNTMFEIGLEIIDEAGSNVPGLEIGIGPKIYAGMTQNQEFVAISLGGLLQFRPRSLNRFLVTGYMHIAPDIVSFLDADNFWEAGINLSYELIPTSSLYIAFRKIWADLDKKSERVIDEGVIVGLLMRF